MSRAGFSLIEALVALAIASVSLLAIFDLQQQMSKTQRRLEAVLNQSHLERSAIAAMEALNPEEQPTGETIVGSDLKVSWTSTPISAERQSIAFPSGPGSYRIRLYRVKLRLHDSSNRPIGEYEIDRVGWRNPTALANGVAPTDGAAR